MQEHDSTRRRLLGATAAGSLLGVAGCASQGAGDTRYAGVPMSTAEQLQLTSVQAVAAVRSGRLTAEEYVRTLLARAQAVNNLNTMIVLDGSAAIAAARQVDGLRDAGGRLPPLAGLPIVVKDNINTAGLPTTGGTPALRNVRPARHAPSLQKLVDAGAIVPHEDQHSTRLVRGLNVNRADRFLPLPDAHVG